MANLSEIQAKIEVCVEELSELGSVCIIVSDGEDVCLTLRNTGIVHLLDYIDLMQDEYEKLLSLN